MVVRSHQRVPVLEAWIRLYGSDALHFHQRLQQTRMNILGHQVQVVRIQRRRCESKMLIELDGLLILGMHNQGSRGNNRLSLKKALQRILEQSRPDTAPLLGLIHR